MANCAYYFHLLTPLLELRPTSYSPKWVSLTLQWCRVRRSQTGNPTQSYQNRLMVGLEPGNGIVIQLELLLQLQLHAPKVSLRRKERIKEQRVCCIQIVPEDNGTFRPSNPCLSPRKESMTFQTDLKASLEAQRVRQVSVASWD